MTRVAIIKKDKCHSEKCNWLCHNICPVNRTGEECITKVDKFPEIDEKLCTGCGICPQRCPFEAIKIVNLPEKLKEDPLIRFGPNTFELFSLPIPKKDKVVGILGRNGIGKSTALAILSNNLKPNFGNHQNPPSEQEITEHFSKTLLGDYFNTLYKNEIKISYKPQRVELLTKYYQGKVKDLLKQTDEKNISKKLVKELDIDGIQDSNLTTLSGGELQRVAIIATISKKADFYYFDEPASFLDITQRIKVAKLIRELSKESPVMVIEHDLATLDYISDEIQIVYGKEAAYGIFSKSKAVRRGVNEYLDGYLPEENIRFRDYSINFSATRAKKTTQETTLLKFPDLEKKFERFKLNIKEGEIKQGEVLTVIGQNGLGKTTFLKILTGLEKPDKGEIEKITISYKPQNLKQLEGKVEEHLKKSRGFSSGWFKTNVLEKLGIKNILNNEVKHLSGGELQKFHLALTLLQEAELLALDEPSAFIDVEDRLKVAEVIKDYVQQKNISAIVVDHDIQFIDYLGDRMLVFTGTPSKKGETELLEKQQGMNKVLKLLEITYRKDPSTKRPRINKPDSQLDKEQKKTGNYYTE